jgi:toxin YoeB
MKYDLFYSAESKKVLEKYKKSNPNAIKKILKLIPELMEHPRLGTGHPEPLKGREDITYSRHISANDRLIYDIDDENLTVNILSI